MRQKFKRLEQEENEDINSFESSMRVKSMLCSYNRCSCNDRCYIMKCGFNREEDEILTLILCNMRDKDLKKEYRV